MLKTMYKSQNGYITNTTWTEPPLEGWTAFPFPLDITGCFAITDELTVDFEKHRERYITPTSFGQSQEDPGDPPDPSVVLATVAACQAWVSTATTEQKACYNSALWVHEQLTRTTPRAGIKSALGVG